MILKILFALLTFVAVLSENPAYANEAVKHTEHTTVHLYRYGPNEVLAEFNIKPDWHISWSNPGDVGQPTTVHAANAELEVVAQSAPQTRILYEIMREYIYENTAYFALKLDNPAAAKLTFDFVECNDVCKPETVSFQLDKIAQTDNAEWQDVYTRATATFPQNISLISPTANNLITLDLPADTPIEFAAPSKDIIDEASIQITPTDDGIQIRWQDMSPQKLKQALIITPEQSYLANIEYQNNFTSSLLYMILLAFLGGIILNAMPCVFPILSLKILTLIKQPQAKFKPLKNAVAYT